MTHGIENTRRSNHSIFFPQSYGSPFNDTAEHISALGLRRLDFEHYRVAGEVIYSVEGDSTPTSQQDEEARIATLAYALKKLGNPEDAAEFMRCLNAICEGGDARYRQVAASYYYGEIAERGAGPVLKEMALVAMHLASLNPVTEEVEGAPEMVYALSGESKPRSLFDLEVATANRMIRGRRKAAGFVYDEWTEWLNDLEANGASLEELDDAFARVEALDQYDEGGAIVRMSAHERAVACGRVDCEFTADDLPERARHLAGYLRRAYSDGVDIEEIWERIDKDLEIIFPVRLSLDGPQAPRRTNLTRGLPDFRLTREEIKAIDPEGGEPAPDIHLTGLRNNDSYRRFFLAIRCALRIDRISEVMGQAREAHQTGAICDERMKRLEKEAQAQRYRLMASDITSYGRPDFVSHANRELQQFTRGALEAILDECYRDCHLTAMRNNRAYRRFYRIIREADDTKIVGQAMKDAYAAKEEGRLSLKHFTMLKTASALQRERLERAPLSKEARRLIREVETASSAKLRYLSWALYGKNQPEHPIHSLPSQMVSRIWDAIRTRKSEISEQTGRSSRLTRRRSSGGEKESGQRQARLDCSRLSRTSLPAIAAGGEMSLSSRFRFLAEEGGGRKPLMYLRSGFVAEQ